MDLLKNNKTENLSLSFKIKKSQGLLSIFGKHRVDDVVSTRTIRALFSRRRTMPIRLDSYRKGKSESGSQTTARNFFRFAA